MQRKQVVLISKLLRSSFRSTKTTSQINEKLFKRNFKKYVKNNDRKKKTIKKIKQIKFKNQIIEITSKNEI